MKKRYYLVFDLGASNGRAILINNNGDKLLSNEIYRFPNDPVVINGHIYWDVLRLFHEIKRSLLICKNEQKVIPDCIGIDTWAVSFGLLDSDGNLIMNPLHYRDPGAENISTELESIMDKQTVYNEIGCCPNPVCSAYQLYYIKNNMPEIYQIARSFVTIPDLFNYWLTGRMATERSFAATTMLFDLKRNQWSHSIIDGLGFDKKLFGHEILPAGTLLGVIRQDLLSELGIDQQINVISTVSHDTAAAATAIPFIGVGKYAYILCGTWAVVGTQVSDILPTMENLNERFTFEAFGCNGIDMRKNFTGLWILQECKKQWEKEGRVYTYSQLVELAREAPAFIAAFDVDDGQFFKNGNMIEKIQEYCKKTNQTVPVTVGEIVRVILESLAFKIKRVFVLMQKSLGYDVPTIHMAGGGIQNTLLCEFVANALGKKIITGPIEATVTGNMMMQAKAMGDAPEENEFRQLIKASFELKIYECNDTKEWDEKYQRHVQMGIIK